MFTRHVTLNNFLKRYVMFEVDAFVILGLAIRPYERLQVNVVSLMYYKTCMLSEQATGIHIGKYSELVSHVTKMIGVSERKKATLYV